MTSSFRIQCKCLVNDDKIRIQCKWLVIDEKEMPLINGDYSLSNVEEIFRS